MQHVKRLQELDHKKLDYSEMSDSELKKSQGMTYSFKFMQTDSDREMLKKAMLERLEKARQKLNARKQGKVGALVRANLPR